MRARYDFIVFTLFIMHVIGIITNSVIDTVNPHMESFRSDVVAGLVISIFIMTSVLFQK